MTNTGSLTHSFSAPQLPKECAVYVAFGIPYLAMALLSAQTFRRFNPGRGLHIISDLPAAIADNLPFWEADQDTWTTVDDSVENNRKYKTNITSIVQAERVAYLDCDTLITGDIGDAFRLLDYFDIALRAHRGPQTHSFLAKIPILDNGMTVEELPHWNGGAVYYKRSDRLERFFHTWQENFDLMKLKFDQPALAKTLIESDLRVLTLDERWNGGFKKINDDRGGVPKIAHYHSALDAQIEASLRGFAEIIAHYTSEEAKQHVDTYIVACRALASKAPIISRMRRIFRRYWHRKYSIIA
jgi:hypothetical protein